MKFVAFFRALNVGKSNRIKSSDLKILFERCGAINVHPILQSGNVVFETANFNQFETELSVELNLIMDTQSYWVMYSESEFIEWWEALNTHDLEAYKGSWLQVLISKHQVFLEIENSEVDVEICKVPAWVVYHPKGVSKSKLQVKSIFDRSPKSTFRNFNTLKKIHQKLLSV